MNAYTIRDTDEYGDEARIYKLVPPFERAPRYNGEEAHTAEYAVASGVHSAFFPHGPETLVFSADANGEVTDFGEIGGGKGYVDPDRAIESMGYTVHPAT